MQGKCNQCGTIGDWPVFSCEVHGPGEKPARQEQDLLCPACYEQIGAPFPEEWPEDELRRWHEEVIRIFREHLRTTDRKPKVCKGMPRLFKEEMAHEHCVLCWECLREQGPRPFIWKECDKVVRPARVCVECAAICGTVTA